jgi:hypothetical protein
MYTTAPRHRILPAFHRDYIHRRRLRRRLTNVILIPLLGGVAAYFITRPTGGKGFTLPKAAQQESLFAVTPRTGCGQPSGSPNSPEQPPRKPCCKFRDPWLTDLPTDRTLSPKCRTSFCTMPNATKISTCAFFIPTSRVRIPSSFFARAGGSQSCCDALTRHWATYGYITLQPTHDDLDVATTKQRRRRHLFSEGHPMR